MLVQYLPLLCVCLSVCLSKVCVLLRRLNLGSRKQRLTIAHGLYFADAKKSWKNGVKGVTSNGGAK